MARTGERLARQFERAPAAPRGERDTARDWLCLRRKRLADRRQRLGVLATAIAGISHAICRRLAEDVERYAAQVELTVLPAPGHAEILPTDFGHADELIAGALAEAPRGLARTVVRLPHLRAA